jgi:hypothetical protein
MIADSPAATKTSASESAWGTARRNLCLARNDFPQQTAEKAKIGSFRTKNYSYDTFPGVLIV